MAENQGFSGLIEKIKKSMESGWKVTRQAAETAGKSVKEFSDKSMLKIEIQQLEANKKKVYKNLGVITEKELSKKDGKVTIKTDGADALLKELKKIDKEIALREKELASEGEENLEKKESVSASKSQGKSSSAAAKKTVKEKASEKTVKQSASKTAKTDTSVNKAAGVKKTQKTAEKTPAKTAVKSSASGKPQKK